MCKTNDVTEQTTRYRNAETNSGAPYTKVKLRPSKSGKGMVAVNSIFTAGSSLPPLVKDAEDLIKKNQTTLHISIYLQDLINAIEFPKIKLIPLSFS